MRVRGLLNCLLVHSPSMYTSPQQGSVHQGLQGLACAFLQAVMQAQIAHCVSHTMLCAWPCSQVEELFGERYTVLLVEDTLATEEDIVSGRCA